MFREIVRIAVAEDDDDFMFFVNHYLGKRGLKVEERYSWMAELTSAVDSGDLDKFDVITLDNDLFGGSVSRENLVQRIKRKYPGIYTIGLSCCPLRDVHLDLGKDKVCQLPEMILRR